MRHWLALAAALALGAWTHGDNGGGGGIVLSPSANTIYATWASGSPSSSTLACGTSPGSYTINAVDNGTQTSVTSHSGIVANLTPSTTYYCQAMSGAVVAGTNSVATTALPASTPITTITYAAPFQPVIDQIRGDSFWNTISTDGVNYINANDSYDWGVGGTGGSNMLFGKVVNANPVTGANINRWTNYLGRNTTAADNQTAKANGYYSLNGIMYVIMGRLCLYSSCGNNQAPRLSQHSFQLMSDHGDHGGTWNNFQTPTVYNANGNPPTPVDAQFLGDRILCANSHFVQYLGDIGLAPRVDNQDAYIYVACGGEYQYNEDNLLLARVPRAKIGNFNAADWQFFKGGIGGDGNLNSNWGTAASATPMLVNVGKTSGLSSIQYIPSVNRYIAFQWYYVTISNSSRFINYEGPHPWGPWTQVNDVSATPPASYMPTVLLSTVATAQPGVAGSLKILASGDWQTPAVACTANPATSTDKYCLWEWDVTFDVH